MQKNFFKRLIKGKMKKLIYVIVALIVAVGMISLFSPQKAKTQSWSNQVKTDTLKSGTINSVNYNNLGKNKLVYVSITDTGATLTDSIAFKVISKKGNSYDTIDVGATLLTTNVTYQHAIVTNEKKTYLINYQRPWIVMATFGNVILGARTGSRTTVFWKGDTP